MVVKDPIGVKGPHRSEQVTGPAEVKGHRGKL